MSPSCANLYPSLLPSSSVFPPPPCFKYMFNLHYLHMATLPLSLFVLPSSFSSSFSLSASYLWFSLPLLNHVWLLTGRIKSRVAHAMLFIRAFHKGWLWGFWSIAGLLWRSHTVRQPVLLTLVWWSNFPLSPEQHNEPSTSAYTDKELCP